MPFTNASGNSSATSAGNTDNSGGGATLWSSVTSKPGWVATINGRVDTLEAGGGSGSGFTPATSLLEDDTSFYFVIPNGAAWLVRRQNKDDLSVTLATATTEPTTLAAVQSLEYA